MKWPELTRNNILAGSFALFVVLSVAALHAAPLGQGPLLNDGDTTADIGDTTGPANPNATRRDNRTATMNCSTLAARQVAPGSHSPAASLNTSRPALSAHSGNASMLGNGASPADRAGPGTGNGSTPVTDVRRAVPANVLETCRLIERFSPPKWVTEMVANETAADPTPATGEDSPSVEAYSNGSETAQAQLALARDLRDILTDDSRTRREATFAAAELALAERKKMAEHGHLNTNATSQLAAQQTKLRGTRALLTAAETDTADQSGPLSRAERLTELGIKVQSAGLKTDTQPTDPTNVTLPATTMSEHDAPSAAAFAILEAQNVEATTEQAADIRALDELPEPVRHQLTDVLNAYLGYYLTIQTSARRNVSRVRAAQLQLLEEAADLETALETTDGSGSTGPASNATDDPDVHISGVVLIDLARDDNTYEEDFNLQIDAGGDDTYTNNAGGANASGNETDAAALIDLGGTDTYNGRNGGGRYLVTEESPSVPDKRVSLPKKGGAAGFLLDGGTGNDTYNATAHGSNGGGRRGVGFLVDAGGTDTYNGSGKGTNGAGRREGTGFLLDAGSGADTYTARKSPSNGGASGGRGFLFDEAGNDTYDGSNGAADGALALSMIDRPPLCRLYPDGGDIQDRLCRVLSVPNPRRAPESGGFLLDGGGTDSYEGPNGAADIYGSGFLLDAGSGDDSYDGKDRGYFSRGAANGGAFRKRSSGFLLDMGGNDTYDAGEGYQNGGATGGRGFLMDGGTGDDTYAADSKGTNGGGFAGGRGFLVDRAGNDSYTAGSKGTNGGAWKGKSTGFLLDLDGNDTYSAKEGRVNGGAGGGRTVGLLYDNAGTDVYRTYLQHCRDCSDIPKGTVGAQVDRGSGTIGDGSREGSSEVLVVDDDAGAGTADCPDAFYQEIQQAVNDAEYGDTVRVCTGTYPGNVTIDTTNVTLRAAAPGQVILDGAHKRRFGVALKAGQTTVTGFTATNFSKATAYGWRPVAKKAAFLALGPQTEVSNNVITDSGLGVIAAGLYTGSLLAETPVSEGEEATVITNNTVTNTRFGLSVARTGNVEVSRNTVRASNRGITVFGAVKTTVHNNRVTGQAVPEAAEQRGITSVRSREITLTDNTVTGFTAPANRERPSGDIDTGMGIEIRTPRGGGNDETTHTLRNNTLANNMYNLHVTSGRRSAYQHIDIDPTNTVNGKPVLYLVGATNLVIGSPGSNDTPVHRAPNQTNPPPPDALATPGYVACVSCTNVTIRELELAHNGQGVLIVKSSGTHVDNVTVHDTLQGISVQGSPANTVVKNSDIRESFQGIVVRHNCASRQDFAITSPLGLIFGKNTETCVSPSVVLAHNTVRQIGLLGKPRPKGQGINVAGAGVTVRRNSITDGYGTAIAMRGSLVRMNQQTSRTDTDKASDVIANSTVVDNAISNISVGVSVRANRGTSVIGNTISDTRLGLTTRGIKSATYRDNIVTNATTGMFISWSADGVTARNNSFREVRWGLDVQFLYGSVSKSNDFGTTNTVNGERILWLNDAIGRTIDASDANMVVCVDCVDVTLKDMTIIDNAHGVVLFDSTASHVRNVTVEDTLKTGVLIRGGQNITVRNSTVIDSSMPILALPGVKKAQNVPRGGGGFLPTNPPQADRLPRQALGSVRIIDNRVTVDDASWPTAPHKYGPGREVRPDLWGHFGIALFDPTAATVSGNTVSGNRWGILQVGRAAPLHIENNTIRHPRQEVGIGRFGSNPHMGGRLGQMLGIRLTRHTTDLANGSIVVRNNTLRAGTTPIGTQNTLYGISIKGGEEAPSTTIADNSVGGYQQSVRVGTKSNNSTITIRRNRLNGAKSASVFVTGPTPGDAVEIHQNLLNPLRFGYGIKKETGGGGGGHMGSDGGNTASDHQPVNATCNRWAAPSGPSSRRMPIVDPVTGEPADGSGSIVSHGHMHGMSNVRFHPWLGESPRRTCATENIGTATPTPIPTATRTPWPTIGQGDGTGPGQGDGTGPGQGDGTGPGQGSADDGGEGTSTVTARLPATATRTATPPPTATPEIVPGFGLGVGVVAIGLLAAVLAARRRD